MSTTTILKPKPKQKKTLRIAIVGADGRKWTKELAEKAKSAILTIIAKYSKPKPNSTFENYDLDYSNLVIVSGHCPVGEELRYCLTCDKWLDTKKGETFWHSQGHTMVKVHKKGGIDTEVEIACMRLGIKTEIYPAEVYQWGDKKTNLMDRELVEKYPNDFEKQFIGLKGFRSRNIQIAEACNILYDIEPAGKCRHCGGKGWAFSNGLGTEQVPCNYCEGDGAYSGGTWTYNYTKKLGKEVHKVIIK